LPKSRKISRNNRFMKSKSTLRIIALKLELKLAEIDGQRFFR